MTFVGNVMTTFGMSAGVEPNQMLGTGQLNGRKTVYLDPSYFSRKNFLAGNGPIEDRKFGRILTGIAFIASLAWTALAGGAVWFVTKSPQAVYNTLGVGTGLSLIFAGIVFRNRHS